MMMDRSGLEPRIDPARECLELPCSCAAFSTRESAPRLAEGPISVRA